MLITENKMVMNLMYHGLILKKLKLAAELFSIYNLLIWVHKNIDYVNFIIFSNSMVSIKLIEGN